MRRKKMSLSNRFKKVDRFENTLFLRTAVLQSSQSDRRLKKYLISEQCDYDRNSHKMITIFTKYTIYDDCSSHKNVMFLSFYRIAIMIIVLLLGMRSWSYYSQKCPIFESIWGLRLCGCNPKKIPYFLIFVRTAIMWSQSSKHTLFLNFCEDCD